MCAFEESRDSRQREEFFDAMSKTERALQADAAGWAEYVAEADEWAANLDGQLGRPVS
jgi:hypothetical protein